MTKRPSVTRPPRVEQSGTSIRIHHSEMIRALTSAYNYTADNPLVYTYVLSPGLDDVFPWLSRVASAYEKYKVNSFAVRYQAGQPTTAGNTIVIAPRYDPGDPAPTTFQEAMVLQDTKSNMAYASFTVPFRGLDHNRIRLVRTPTDAEGDVQEYDFGAVNILYAGVASFVGYIWVDYDITLISAASHPSISGVFYTNSNAGHTIAEVTDINGSGSDLDIRLYCPTYQSRLDNGDGTVTVRFAPASSVFSYPLALTAVAGCTITQYGTGVGGTALHRVTPTPGATYMQIKFATNATVVGVPFTMIDPRWVPWV